MSGHLRKIMHKQSSDTLFPNTPPIMVKNEVDVIAYAENNQTDPQWDITGYKVGSLDWCDSHFNGQLRKKKHGRRQTQQQ